MTCCQRNKLVTPVVKEGGCADQERTSPLLDQGRESGVKIALGIRVEDNDLYTQAGCRLVYISHLSFGTEIVRGDKRGDGRGFGNCLVQQPQPFGFEPGGELIYSREVATRPIDAGDEAELHRIGANREHNWGRRGCLLCSEHTGVGRRNNDVHLKPNQIRRQCRHAIQLTLRKAGFDSHVLAFDVTRFLQAFAERCTKTWHNHSGCPGAEEPDHRHLGLLCTCAEWARDRCAAEKCDELTPLHATPRSTRMPEYQMADARTKAIIASRSAGARDVGLGSSSPVPAR